MKGVWDHNLGFVCNGSIEEQCKKGKTKYKIRELYFMHNMKDCILKVVLIIKSQNFYFSQTQGKLLQIFILKEYKSSLTK